MKIEDGSYIVASNVATTILARLSSPTEKHSLRTVIVDVVQATLIRIAEKQEWREWPSERERA